MNEFMSICNSLTHSGCVKYLKSAIVLDGDRIICCNDEQATNSSSESDSQFFDAIEQQATDNKVDLRIFNYVIKQKDLLIKELYDKIELMHQHINLLKDAIQKPSIRDNSTKTSFPNTCEIPQKNKNKDKPSIEKDNITTRNPNDIQGASQQVVATALSVEQTKLKMKEIINLTKDIDSDRGDSDRGSTNVAPLQPSLSAAETNDNAAWKQVEHRRRRRNIVVGNRNDAEVKGVPKIAQLHVKNFNVNFICLTETWCTSLSISSFHHDNFVLGSYYCRQMFRAGGVAIFVKQSICFTNLPLQHFCADKEIEICGISYKHDSGKAIIMCCYRAPNSNCATFIKSLLDALNSVYKPGVTVFLVGDLNIDSMSRPREFRILCNELFTFGLTPRVNWPTRVTQQTVTVIDHIFSNCSDDAVACVLDNDISDHRTILFDCGFKIATNSSQHNLPKRSFNTNSTNTFHDDISNEAWSDLYKASDINSAYNIFYRTFCYYFEKHFPKYKAKSRCKRKDVGSVMRLFNLVTTSRTYIFSKRAFHN
nr:unnamed protein product [Callosobruchus analis]